MADDILRFLGVALTIYMICVFAWALISWLPMISPSLAFNPTVVSIRRFLDSVVEPYVGLFRKFIPPVQMGGTYIDLSALAAIGVLIVLGEVLDSLA